MTRFDKLCWRVDKILEYALKAWQHPECRRLAEKHAERLKGEIHAIERLMAEIKKPKD